MSTVTFPSHENVASTSSLVPENPARVESDPLSPAPITSSLRLDVLLTTSLLAKQRITTSIAESRDRRLKNLTIMQQLASICTIGTAKDKQAKAVIAVAGRFHKDRQLESVAFSINEFSGSVSDGSNEGPVAIPLAPNAERGGNLLNEWRSNTS